DTAMLTQENPASCTAFRVPAGATRLLQHEETYMGASGENIEPAPDEWAVTTGDTLIVTNPLDELVVNLAIGGDRSKIADLIVDLKYEDPENGIIESKSFFINQTNMRSEEGRGGER